MVMEIIVSIFLLFLGIAMLVIIHICIVGRAFSRGFETDDFPIIKGAGMTIKDLKKLPCFEYKQGEEKATSASAAAAAAATIIDCAVCLDSFKVGDNCRILPNCHHYFHVQCVDAWLIKTPFCPICRSFSKLLPKVASNIGQAGMDPSIHVADDVV